MKTTLTGPDVIYEVPVEEMLGVERERLPLAANARRGRRRREVWSTEPRRDPNVINLIVRTAVITSDRRDSAEVVVVDDVNELPPMLRNVALLDQEHLIVVGLTGEGEVVFVHEAAVGGLQSLNVETRQVAKLALLTGVRDVVIFHNHPSGDAGASLEDRVMTNALREMFECLDLTLKEHFVIARGGYYGIEQNRRFRW